jgi:DNA uptake protein ComE-like DNA-binding protein
MKTIALIVGFAVATYFGAGALPAFAQDQKSEEAIHKAMKDLQELELRISRLGDDLIGRHRDKTVDLVREAQRELRLGLQYAASRGAMREGELDINSATWGQLRALPGINDETAKKIAGGAPYAKKQDLVSRKVLTQDQYDKIKDKIVATSKKK